MLGAQPLRLAATHSSREFGLDGTEHEIDLNAGHAQQLRDALAAYVRAGRRVSVNDRGRVPAELIVKFKAATGQ